MSPLIYPALYFSVHPVHLGKQVNLFWSSYMIMCWNEHECNYLCHYFLLFYSSKHFLLMAYLFFYLLHSHTNFAALLFVKVLSVGLLITAWPHELLKLIHFSFKLAASFLGIKPKKRYIFQNVVLVQNQKIAFYRLSIVTETLPGSYMFTHISSHTWSCDISGLLNVWNLVNIHCEQQVNPDIIKCNIFSFETYLILIN